MDLLDWGLATVIIISSLVRIAWMMNLNKIALKEYSRSNSSVQAVHKIGRWEIFRQCIILFTGFLAGFLTFKLWKQTYFVIDGNLLNLLIIPLVIVFFYYISSIVIDVVIGWKTSKTIRKIDQTLGEAIVEIIPEHSVISMFFLLPVLSWIVASFIPFEGLLGWLLPDLQVNDTDIIVGILRYAIPPIVSFIIIGIMAPYILILTSKSTSVNDPEIEDVISEIMNSCGKKNLKVYKYPSKKQKDANAVVIDDSKGKILVSDYLIENLTKEEFKAVILHEIAHVENRHLKKMAKTKLLPTKFKYSAFLLGVGSLIAYPMFPQFSTVLDILGILGLIMMILVLIDGFLVSFVISFQTSRKHEKEADEYVIKSGIQPQVFISALQKIYYLSDAPKALGKLEEKFSTHPSLEKRITYILEFDEAMKKEKKA